ncbi:unnamed protein product [Ascophyllum nodosum]
MGDSAPVSRWAQRKQQRELMYATSSDAVQRYRKKKIEVKTMVCQKCLQIGHWTYECKGKPAYKARVSRTQILENPSLKPKFHLDLPPGEKGAEDHGAGAAKVKTKTKIGKKRRRDDSSSSSSSSGSSSSDDSSSSDSSSSGSSGSESSSSSSSESSSSDSDSDSSSGSESNSDSDSSRTSSSASSSGSSSSGSSSSGSSSSGSSSSGSDDDSDSDSSSSSSRGSVISNDRRAKKRGRQTFRSPTGNGSARKKSSRR